MARFSGPAGRGASRTLRAIRRAAADHRQAQDAYTPLSGEKLDELLNAIFRRDAIEAWRMLRGGGAR